MVIALAAVPTLGAVQPLPRSPSATHPPSHPGQGYTNSTIDYNSSVDGFPLSYSEILPTNFSASATYPLAVELHGISPTETTAQRGGYPTIVYNSTAEAAIEDGFILVVPNTRTGTGFYVDSKYTGPQGQDVLDAIAHEKALRHIGKVYLYGFSMGSFGALSLGLNHPGMFAALGAIAAFSDDFELEDHLIALNSTGLENAGLGITGGLWPNASAYARGLFAELSPLRWHPTNASGTPIYVASGGNDILSTNNPAFWSYEQANDTVLQTTCQVASAMSEPASCTEPLAELAALDPANYSYRYIYEPNGPHDYALLNATDMFAFFTGQVPDGPYWGIWPQPTPMATPTPLLTIATSPMNCGAVEFAGARYASGTTIGPTAGTYNVSFDPCTGTSLQRVVAEGGVSYDAASSSVSITRPGALVAYFAPAQAGTFSVALSTNLPCGDILLNGTLEPPTTTVSLAAAVYPILGQPCGAAAATFAGWQTTGAVSVVNASASATQLVVDGNGSLDAMFTLVNPPPTVPLQVDVAPTQCGPLAVAGQNVPGGATVDLPTGAHNLTAPACAGYSFSAWSSSGGISLNSSGPVTTFWLSAAATLTAVYAVGSNGFYDVGVTVDPGSCGAVVDIGGVVYSNLSHALLGAGNYSLSAGGCPSMIFDGWSASGSVSTSGGSLIVAGNGTVTAQYIENTTGTGPGGPTSAGNASPGPSPYLWGILGAVVGGGVVGGAALVLRRRPRPAEPPSDEPSE